MRSLLFFFFTSAILFAHSMKDHEDLHHDTLNYGIFANIAYRDLDLYPRGIEGSIGYENHGETKKVQLHHIGFFLDGNYNDTWIYGMEINRHVDAPSSFNSYLEKLYAGYQFETTKILLGRLYDAISFVNQKAWGYGFAQMPLSVDSFFDGSYITDAFRLEQSYSAFTSSLHLAQEKYTQAKRATLRVSYKAPLFTLATYFQWREKAKIRIDYSTTQHLHSHDNQGECDNLEFSERCFERQSKLFGLAIDANYNSLSYLAEYIYLDTQGDISNSQYKIQNHNKIHTLYGQAIYNLSAFDVGLRAEVFHFQNEYEGAGALKVAETMTSEHANSSQYLLSFMGSYSLNKYNKTILQAEKSQDDWAFRINHTFIFSDGF